jgi:hypothetical protein
MHDVASSLTSMEWKLWKASCACSSTSGHLHQQQNTSPFSGLGSPNSLVDFVVGGVHETLRQQHGAVGSPPCRPSEAHPDTPNDFWRWVGQSRRAEKGCVVLGHGIPFSILGILGIFRPFYLSRSLSLSPSSERMADRAVCVGSGRLILNNANNRSSHKKVCAVNPFAGCAWWRRLRQGARRHRSSPAPSLPSLHGEREDRANWAVNSSVVAEPLAVLKLVRQTNMVHLPVTTTARSSNSMGAVGRTDAEGPHKVAPR